MRRWFASRAWATIRFASSMPLVKTEVPVLTPCGTVCSFFVVVGA